MKAMTALFGMMTIISAMGSVASADPGSEKFELVCGLMSEGKGEKIRKSLSSDGTFFDKQTENLSISVSVEKNTISISVVDKKTMVTVDSEGQNKASLHISLGADADDIGLNCGLE